MEAPAREAPPAAPRRPALGRLPLLIAAGVVAALALVAVVAFLLFGGGGGEEAGGERLELPDVPVTIDPAQLSRFQAIADTLPEPQGETDRDQLRSLIGPPDTFTITFERAGADGSGPTVRYETWFYYDLGTAYEFADGGFVQDMPMTLTGGPVLLPPRRYDPALFGRDTTWEEITALLLDPAAFGPIELEEEYEVPLTFYAGEQLIVAFDDEGLFSVESVALAEGEE